MSAYTYRAARQDGAIVSGAIEAECNGQAATILTSRGLYAISLAPATEEQRPSASRRDLAIVFQSIAALVSAGVPLERAVASSQALARGPLRETLSDARSRLHEGEGFAQALGTARGVVPGIVLGMVRAGGRGRQLPLALEQVATHLEQEAELVVRVRQALAYPLLLA